MNLAVVIGCSALGGAAGAAAYAIATRSQRKQAGTEVPPSGARTSVVSRHGLAIATSLSVVVSAGIALRCAPTAVLPAYALFAGACIAASVQDLATLRISRHLVLATCVLGGALLVVASAESHTWSSLLRAALSWIVVFAALFAIHLLSPSGFGFGDVRLGAMCAGFLGWAGAKDVADGLGLAIFSAGLVGALLLVAGVASRRSKIPFGPFLAAGALATLLLA